MASRRCRAEAPVEGRKGSQPLEFLQHGGQNPVADGFTGMDGIESFPRREERLARIHATMLEDGVAELLERAHGKRPCAVISRCSRQARQAQM